MLENNSLEIYNSFCSHNEDQKIRKVEKKLNFSIVCTFAGKY